MHAILSQWIGGAKSSASKADAAVKESKSTLSPAKDASFIGVMMKLLGINGKDASAKEKSTDLKASLLTNDKQNTASKDKQTASAVFPQITAAATNVIRNGTTSGNPKKELIDQPQTKSSASLAQMVTSLTGKANGKTNTTQQGDKSQNNAGETVANSLPVRMDGNHVKKGGKVDQPVSDKQVQVEEESLSFLGKNMMSAENASAADLKTVPGNDKQVSGNHHKTSIPQNSLKAIAQKETEKNGDKNAAKETKKVSRTDSSIKANQVEKTASQLKTGKGDPPHNKPSLINTSSKSINKLPHQPDKSQNPAVTVRKESIKSQQSRTAKVLTQQKNSIKSTDTRKKPPVILINNRLKTVSAPTNNRLPVKQDFTLFKSVSTPTDVIASPASQMEMDSNTSKDFKDDSDQQFKEIHLNNLKAPQFAEAAGQKSFGKQLAQVGRQHISQGQKTSQQTSSQWKHHRFVLKDGKAIHIAARSSDGSLQLQLNAGNGELGKMLHQHLHEIQQHVQQQLNIEIDLQLQDFGGQQPKQESETTSPNQPKSESNMKGSSLTMGVNHPVGTQQVRYFGFNRNEWTA